MKTLFISIFCLMAVCGKGQNDSLERNYRLERAAQNMRSYSNQSIAGMVSLAGSGTIMTVAALSKMTTDKRSGVMLASGAFAVFGAILFFSAPIHLHNASIWLSPTGAAVRF